MLIDCPVGRYTKGEIGEVLKNDFDKYDYRIELSPVRAELSTPFIKEGTEVKRIYYFYKNEVELLKGEMNKELTLKEIKTEKNDLEKILLNVIRSFETLTGVEVDNIEWRRESIIGNRNRPVIDISIDALIK